MFLVLIAALTLLTFVQGLSWVEPVMLFLGILVVMIDVYFLANPVTESISDRSTNSSILEDLDTGSVRME